MHLLVLDDEERIASFIVAVAEGIGWTAEAALDETAFQASFRRTMPDLIMLDLQLGSSDGVEQLRYLHREDFRGDVVLVSGFDRRVLAAAEQLGTSLGLTVSGILQKPARASEVRAFLRHVAHGAPQAESAREPAGIAAAPAGRLSPLS